MDIDKFLEDIRYIVGDGEMSIEELWVHFQQTYPNMTRETFEYFLTQLDLDGEYKVSQTLVYKKKVEKMAPNQNKTSIEDVMNKNKKPVGMPANQNKDQKSK